MAEHFSINFICLFIAFFMLCVYAEEREKLVVYQRMNMDKDTICDPLPQIAIGSKTLTKSIDLSKFRNNALLVNAGQALNNWRGTKNKDCKFKVKAMKGEGLFAVIQSMNLRREGSECLDYIRFTPENGNSSEKFCGDFERIPDENNFDVSRIQSSDNQDINPAFLIKYYEESSGTGKITTEIHIDKKPINAGEILNLTITFTPFRGCSNQGVERDDKIFRKRLMCISSIYVCDGYTNCVSSMCNDEDSSVCSQNEMSAIDGYKALTLTAVTSTFLCFIIFVMCLYICRKHEKLCWSSDCAGPSDSVNVNGLPMDRGDQISGNRPYVSSAPMLEVAVSSVHDKDLPPSYDSLFPAETSTASA